MTAAPHPVVATLDDVQREKIKHTVIAKAALVGLEVHELADGTFIGCRWGYTTAPLPDLDAVQALVRRMGGAA